MTERRDTRMGTTIAGLREQRGWSQRALAKVVGLDQSAVSRIEAGKRPVAAGELEAFAQALDVPPASLREASSTPLATQSALRGPQRLDLDALLIAVDDADAVYQRIHARRSEPDGLPLPAREAGRASRPQPATDARSARPARSGHTGAPGGAALPSLAEDVIAAWSALRDLAGPRSVTPPTTSNVWSWETPRDRIARFWRQELRIDLGSPVPDLVPLLEDAAGVEVIIARLGDDTPACGCAVRDGAAFVFVNAARPVVLQRFALAHAFGHLVLGHGDIVDERIDWGRGHARESETNDFAEELLAPAAAVAGWYDRHGDPAPDVDTMVELANAFGISFWAAMERSNAAHKLSRKRQTGLTAELRRLEWHLLPRQAFLGGLKDTLTALTPEEVLLRGAYGPPAVLRVPARMRAWALRALACGRLSLEAAAGLLSLDAETLAGELERPGVE